LTRRIEERLLHRAHCVLVSSATTGLMAALRAVCGNFVAKPLEEFGTKEQIDTWLRPVVSGEFTTALAITEPDAGSDVASIATNAVRDGDRWRLNGVKRHISGATESDFILAYVATNPDAGPHQRLSAFIVPTATPGVDASGREHTMGIRGMSHSRIEFHDVELSDEHLLGAPGDGMRILIFGLAAERIDIASRALGCATRAFEEARAYADVRIQSGRPIRAFQAVSQRLAEMRIILDAGRLLVLRAARLYDTVLAELGPEQASEACNEESSIAKAFCSEQCFHVCDMAMQVFGGLGYEQGTAVEAMFRDSRVFRFGGGTDEINKHIIQRDEYKRLKAARGQH
jgi:alkylation response protein AidB-like acyl-CoA dehydrogenase